MKKIIYLVSIAVVMMFLTACFIPVTSTIKVTGLTKGMNGKITISAETGTSFESTSADINGGDNKSFTISWTGGGGNGKVTIKLSGIKIKPGNSTTEYTYSTDLELKKQELVNGKTLEIEFGYVDADKSNTINAGDKFILRKKS